jgi:hypothetical protein
MTDTTADIVELIQLVNRTFAAADARDWDTYRALMADEVTVDFGGIGPHATGTVDSDSAAARTRAALDPIELTQHMLTSHVVDIDGDTATVRFYEQALHRHAALSDDLARNTWILYGKASRTATRTPAGWRITGSSLTPTHHVGNPNLLTDVAALNGDRS